MVTVPAVIVYDQILVPGRNDRSFVYIINSIRVRSRLYIRAYYLLFYGMVKRGSMGWIDPMIYYLKNLLLPSPSLCESFKSIG